MRFPQVVSQQVAHSRFIVYDKNALGHLSKHIMIVWQELCQEEDTWSVLFWIQLPPYGDKYCIQNSTTARYLFTYFVSSSYFLRTSRISSHINALGDPGSLVGFRNK
jgi:hypothetical protein